MSYERDRDRMTRGVGAIAALDGVMPSRGAVRRRINQATQRRDRSMVAVTDGALGMTALGLVRDTRGPATSTIKTPVRATTVDHRTNKPPPPSNLPPAAPPPGGGVKLPPGGYGPPPPSKTPYPGMPTSPVIVMPTPVVTPVPVPTPAPTPTAPTTKTTTTTTTTSTGGGGAGMPKAPTTTPIVPTVAAPTPDPDISSGMTDQSKMLIIGGLALGAILLLRRGDR